MKQIGRNKKYIRFSLLGAMLEVNILRKFLDYTFIENKVYAPQVETVECVKDELKVVFYHSKGFRLLFWNTIYNYTNVLKYKRFFIRCSRQNKISSNSVFDTF